MSRPWETKTIEYLTQAEMLEWVQWYIARQTHPDQEPWQLAQDIMHNILLWERSRLK